MRILSATNRDLQGEIREERFREDLFYRLNVATVRIPPLRERRGDISVLLRAFLKRFSATQKKEIKGFSREAQHLLEEYDWPGNVRELEHAVEHAVIMCQGPLVKVAHLPEPIRKHAGNMREDQAVILPVGIPLKEAEKTLILKTLESAGYHRGKAAEILGISKRKIEYLLKAWDMEGLGRKVKRSL